MPFETLDNPMGHLSGRIVSAGDLGVLWIGDSQQASRAPASGADQAFGVSTPVPTTFVKVVKNIAQSLTDPPTYDITATAVAAQTYTGTGSVVMVGPDYFSAQVLHGLGIKSVITTYSIVGLPCKDAVPSPSPAYPTSGASWINGAIAFQRNVEATYGVTTGIVVTSLGNNDGLNSTDSNNLPANMALYDAAIAAAFPSAQRLWLIINPDTDNFPSFISATRTRQATELAALTSVLQLSCNDRALLSDHAHLDANGQKVYASRAIYRGLRARGVADPRPASIPTVVGYGPATADNGTSAPTSDGSPINNDLELLIGVQMVASGQESTLTTPSGWTAVANATSTTNPTTGFAVRLAIAKRTVTTTMLNANTGNTAPTSQPMDSPNTVNYTDIITIRGPSAGQVPSVGNVTFGTTTSGNVTTIANTGVTTGGTNRLVLAVTVGFTGGAGTACTVSLSGLSGAGPVRNGVVVTPNSAACVIDVQSAQKAVAGATGTVTATLGLSTTSPVLALIEITP